MVGNVSIGALDILPDCRLKEKKGTVMVDWDMPDRSVVRIECEPVYCATCGKLMQYCPLENTTYAFALCQPCFDKWGLLAGTYAVPDDVFNAAVAEQMMDSFGKYLTAEQLVVLDSLDELPRALRALEKDSPYKVYNQ